MLEQIEGDTLSLYGPQSLEAFDRNWGMQAAGAVNTIVFKFIDFDSIVKQLPKIRVRFPATTVGSHPDFLIGVGFRRQNTNTLWYTRVLRTTVKQLTNLMKFDD